ncbi:MAG: hypothetical protein ACYDEJ_13945 [Desulfitobacteriaceae bacterium]
MFKNGFGLRTIGKTYPQVEETIQHFRQLLKKYRVKQRFPFMGEPKRYSSFTDQELYIDTKGLFVVGHCFEQTYIEKLIQAYTIQIEELIRQSFSDVNIYKIDFVLGFIYVFYENIKDKNKYDNDGTSTKIESICFEFLINHDEYSLINTTTNFFRTDSDELVRTKYVNYFNYYR